ncbi:MAG: DUF4276 family protein [Gammaproteobacteria bacterium]|nr:DUF4276 family protein [Gammaproteobacteria bacterium]
MPKLREFLQLRVSPQIGMPRLIPVPQDGRLPTFDKLRRLVGLLLDDRQRPAHAVIALTDVYTGTRDFIDAADAKKQMIAWVGNEPRFYPHVALHDFEAWLIPFWPEIQQLAGSKRAQPSLHPETLDHGKPPAHILKEVFRTGSKGKSYVKPRDAARIMRDKSLELPAANCPELKALLNTLLVLCQADRLP